MEQVNAPQTDGEMEALRREAQRGTPFGEEAWQSENAGGVGAGVVQATAKPTGGSGLKTKPDPFVFLEKLGLRSTFQMRGRPRKQEGQDEK